MINKIKKNKLEILELIIIFIVTLLFNLMFTTISADEIWCYGFAHNIVNGLIPYKDFNMIISPLIPLINAMFLSIFWKNLLVFHILNAILYIVIYYIIKRDYPNAHLMVYAILLPCSFPQYNIICILLVLVIVHLEKNKQSDYLIGVILGLTFLTKQSIGIFLCIPTLFTKDIKRITKRVIGFIIPNIFILIYLVHNNILYEFIDYTFLGLNDFAQSNQTVDIYCIVIIFIALIYLIHKYIKSKDMTILYYIMFLIMVYPICEISHVIKAIIPTLCMFLNQFKVNKMIVKIAFTMFVAGFFIISIYGIYTNEYAFPNETRIYKYRSIEPKGVECIKKVSNYIKKSQDIIYIISHEAYLFKLEADMPINKYDLLNNGNLGKSGVKKLINGIKDNCNNKQCTFIINYNLTDNNRKENRYSQYNQEIIYYVIDNYKSYGNLYDYNLIIYKNY